MNLFKGITGFFTALYDESKFNPKPTKKQFKMIEDFIVEFEGNLKTAKCDCWSKRIHTILLIGRSLLTTDSKEDFNEGYIQLRKHAGEYYKTKLGKLSERVS